MAVTKRFARHDVEICVEGAKAIVRFTDGETPSNNSKQRVERAVRHWIADNSMAGRRADPMFLGVKEVQVFEQAELATT